MSEKTGKKVESRSPAQILEDLVGGVRPAARRLECNPSNIIRWKKTGRIPGRWHAACLALGMTADQIIGGDVVESAKIRKLRRVQWRDRYDGPKIAGK